MSLSLGKIGANIVGVLGALVIGATMLGAALPVIPVA